MRGEAVSRELVNPSWFIFIEARVNNNVAKWGIQDFETLGLAVCEEAGELAQAILQHKYEGGERGRISSEALDLAALCIQVLITMVQNHGTENIMKGLSELMKEGSVSDHNHTCARCGNYDSPKNMCKVFPLTTPAQMSAIKDCITWRERES